MRPLRLPIALARRLMDSPSGSMWLLRVRVRLALSRPALPTPSGRHRAWSLGPPALLPGCSPHGRQWDLTGCLATLPALLPCSTTPAGSVALAMAGFPMLPPPGHQRRLRHCIISRLTHRFDACCLRFTNAVADAHARLASGWRAPPLPGGIRTHWIAKEGFRSSHPPSQAFACRNVPRYPTCISLAPRKGARAKGFPPLREGR